MEHVYEGVGLDLRKTQAVLANLHRLWGQPVGFKTVLRGKPTLLRYDGEHRMEELP